MARTNSTLVKALLSYNYDGTSDLSQYISTANVVTTRLATFALDNYAVVYSATELALVETWLAAHFYTRTDPLYTGKNTDKAAGQWQPREYLEGAFAIAPLLKTMLDPSKRAGAAWLGKTELEQLTYDQRMG